tara:strand:- start:358 stop:735 length:378 start_codon:yes stop_codon:yes gene_type:complete
MKIGGGGAGESTRKKPVSPRHGSKTKTKQILEAALKKTALEIRDVSMRELERDATERLTLSHSKLVFRNDHVFLQKKLTPVSKVQFKRMNQKRRQAKNKIADLTKKSNRLKRALRALDCKGWGKV